MRTKGTSFITAIAAVAALAALSGCGGGGGGGGGGGVGPIGGGPAAQTVTLQPGDTWTYNVTGTATAPNQKTSTLTGTITRTIQPASSFNGQSLLSIQEVSNYNISGGGLTASGGGTTVTYFTQDPNTFNISEVGQVINNGNTTETVTSGDTNTVIIPGAWANGDSTSANFTYTDGTSFTQTFDITGSQAVAVPAGTFNVWVATVTVDGGSPSAQTWDPALGSYVTNNFTQTLLVNGVTWTLTFNAKLKSVSGPGI